MSHSYIVVLVEQYGSCIYREGGGGVKCVFNIFRSSHGLLVRVETMLQDKNLSFIDRLVHSVH